MILRTNKNKTIELISILVLTTSITFSILSPSSIQAAGSSMSRAEQEEKTLQCKGPENPVGETLETAIAFAGNLNSILSRIIADSKIIFKASDDLAAVAAGCTKKRCRQKCSEGEDGSKCCHYSVITNYDGSTSTICDLSCNTLACHSKCENPPCGYGGMGEISNDLSIVGPTLTQIKNLRKQYERTLISYIDIYKWAFGQAYACNSGGVCVKVNRLSTLNPVAFPNPTKYLNPQCNNACVPAGKVVGYECKNIAPANSTQPDYECQASAGKNYFSNLADCQKTCGLAATNIWKCDTTIGSCQATYDGSGIYSDQNTCNNNCFIGMETLNISPMSECDPQWATTSLGSSTICQHGDSLTDVAMAVNYFIGGFNPSTTLSYLENHAVFPPAVKSNNDINWQCLCPHTGIKGVKVQIFDPSFVMKGYSDWLSFAQDNYLSQNIPLVMECDSSLGSPAPAQQDGSYSILLTGYDKNKQIVHYIDPQKGQQTMTKTDYYSYKCGSEDSGSKHTAYEVYYHQSP